MEMVGTLNGTNSCACTTYALHKQGLTSNSIETESLFTLILSTAFMSSIFPPSLMSFEEDESDDWDDNTVR